MDNHLWNIHFTFKIPFRVKILPRYANINVIKEDVLKNDFTIREAKEKSFTN